MKDASEAIFNSYRRALKARNRSDQTITLYRKAVEDLDRYLGRDVSTASQADIESYLSERLGQVSAQTVAINYCSLRAFYNWLADEGEIATSPMAKLTAPRPADVAPEVLTDEQLRQLIKACGGRSFEDRRDEAIIRLFCGPGSPRLGEMSALRVSHLDLKTDLITVTGKSGTRTIPFGSKTGSAIDKYLRLRAKHSKGKLEALWIGRDGALSPGAIAQMLNRRSRKAGLERINPHLLRHTAAHAWFDNGGSELNSMSLFGWRSPSMPQRYGRSAAVTRAQKSARRASLGDRL